MAEDLLLLVEKEDPLQDYNGLSLFPKTFSALSLPNPPPQSSIDFHNFLKSLPVRNPVKLIKEAETILHNPTEEDEQQQVPNPNKMTNNNNNKQEVEVEVENGAVKYQYPRGQRPGLQRKRPRFSLLPDIRQPSVNLEPSLDFDKLKDPEEFFSAYERLENAKKEIAKQTGRTFTDSGQYNVFNVPRSQRPGIEGRSRMAKYKHLYPAMPSQETIEMDSQSNIGSQQEIAHTASQQTQPANVASQLGDDISRQTESVHDASDEMELTSSVVKVEKKVNKLLDDLLASEELEGDGAFDLLRDRLQIRPLHIEKLNLPELQDVQRIDFRASEVNLPKPRNILSDINNLLKGTRSRTPMKRNSVETSVHSVGSPTPPKSPLASLSLLKQRIFQSNPSNDPFSADDIEQSPVMNAASDENTNKHSVPVDVEKKLGMSGDLNSQTNEENDGAAGNMSSTKVATEDFTSLCEKQADENLTSVGTGGGIDPLQSGLMLDDNNVHMYNQADADLDLETNRPNELEDIVADVQQEAVTSAQPAHETDGFPVETSNSTWNNLGESNTAVNDERAEGGCPEIQNDAPEQAEGTALKQHIEEIQEPTMVLMKKKTKAKKHPHKGRASKALYRKESHADHAMVNQAMDECPGYQDSAQEQHQGTVLEENNEKNQESSVISMNEQTKGKSHSNREFKRKAFSRRQSLAGCGMSWDNGVRRSTRIKSRPLEYWKGERFLYGRIHESLATVIGIKYASPGKENGTLKVKSFVSDEYNELLEQAALY